jgi:hypothetical protein
MGASNPGRPVKPSEALGSAAHSRHDVQFYSKEEFLLNSVSGFLAHSLCTGGSAVIIATQAHRDGFLQLFRSHHLDPTSLVNEGRYIALDAQETLATFMSEGRINEELFVEMVGGIINRAITLSPAAQTPVAVFGEMVALLWQQGASKSAFQLEQMWNRLAETRTFALVCAYPLSCFDPKEDFNSLLNLCAEHTTAIYSDSASALLHESESLRCAIDMRRTEDDLTESLSERHLAIERTIELHDENVELVRQLQQRQLTDEARTATLKSLAINLALLERDLELSPHGRQIAERSLVLVQVLLEDVRQLYGGIEFGPKTKF